jgi:hypothetical protein
MNATAPTFGTHRPGRVYLGTCVERDRILGRTRTTAVTPIPSWLTTSWQVNRGDLLGADMQVEAADAA